MSLLSSSSSSTYTSPPSPSKIPLPLLDPTGALSGVGGNDSIEDLRSIDFIRSDIDGVGGVSHFIVLAGKSLIGWDGGEAGVVRGGAPFSPFWLSLSGGSFVILEVDCVWELLLLGRGGSDGVVESFSLILTMGLRLSDGAGGKLWDVQK